MRSKEAARVLLQAMSDEEDLTHYWNELRPDSKGAKDAIALRIARQAEADREKLRAPERLRNALVMLPKPDDPTTCGKCGHVHLGRSTRETTADQCGAACVDRTGYRPGEMLTDSAYYWCPCYGEPKAEEPAPRQSSPGPRQNESSPVFGWREDVRRMKRRQMGWGV